MKNIIKKFLIIITLFLISSCTNKKSNSETSDSNLKDSISADVVMKGENLVKKMGCNDCHSPKRMGQHGPEIIPELMLSGFPSDRPIAKFDSPLLKEGFAIFYPDLTAAAGPWGVSFAGNLTPDETGIKDWTFEQFKKAITEGKYKGIEGTRMLLPPMPWTNFTTLTNEEINCIYQYLRSIKPVNNLVPSPIPPDKM